MWVASYPRSGNTWLRIFIHNLFDAMNGVESRPNSLPDLTRYSASERAWAYYKPFLKVMPSRDDWKTVAAVRPLAQAEIARRATGAIFVKTHLAFIKMDGHPTINGAVTRGAVYLVRNPLDVACSMAPHYDISIDQAISFMETHMWSELNTARIVHQTVSSWSHNVETWTTRPTWPVHVMRYEDMLGNAREAFAGFVAFAGLHPLKTEVDAALERSTFEKLRKNETAAGFGERPSFSTASFFREGRAGQWKDLLTDKQAERIVSAHGAQMRRFGYLPET